MMLKSYNTSKEEFKPDPNRIRKIWSTPKYEPGCLEPMTDALIHCDTLQLFGTIFELKLSTQMFLTGTPFKKSKILDLLPLLFNFNCKGEIHQNSNLSTKILFPFFDAHQLFIL